MSKYRFKCEGFRETLAPTPIPLSFRTFRDTALTRVAQVSSEEPAP